MNKKIFSIIILLLIILAGVGYYFFFRDTGDVVITPPDDSNPFDIDSEDRLINPGDAGEDDDRTTSSSDIYSPYRRISLHPVAGFSWFSGEAFYPEDRATSTVDLIEYSPEKGDVIRYIDKERGHVYEAYTSSSDIVRLSNTTIPRVHESFFLADGNIIFRYLEESGSIIKTFLGTLTERTVAEKRSLGVDEQTEYTTEGSFLVDDILWLSSSPQKDAFVYLTEEEGVTNLFKADSSNENVERISLLDTSEWIIDWIDNGTLSLQTKASSEALGYLYSLSSRGGTLQPLFGGQEGFVSLVSPNEDYVLFSANTNDVLNLFLYTRSTGDLKNLSIKTLAEKCVWTQDSLNIYCAEPQNKGDFQYPDAWYKGLVSFDDVFWRIEVSTEKTDLLLNPEDFNEPPVDATKLSMSEDDKYLFFVDKKTWELWLIALPEQQSTPSNTLVD